ncbi:hypothetical protein C9374_005971 [Naegleria lovaniensis]|uniref:Uncharacterized protein n=1 Tax=Naegleria lovaniensis TaxID=51637 RepID=A0AA88KHX0_NAELO|nr:uncharacterized protein C9374_005971 [Naegleria lovaniensis]KAG2381587.1 hypothetical protein C9374_005971 [Naegleria lovaniensis]
MGCFDCGGEPETKKHIKLVLLGTAQSGKSTFFKQLRVINNKPFSEKERISMTSVVRENLLEACYSILKALHTLNIPLASQENEEIASQIMTLHKDSSQNLSEILTTETAQYGNMGAKISKIWKDPGMRQALLKRYEFSINDSADYFLDHCERICKPDFIATQEDIIKARTKTVGITEVEFESEGCMWKFTDVGGQRAERRKWVHAFVDTTAVIFITSLNDFDMMLEEDKNTNRMHESMLLFREVCDLECFKEIPIIILFNKDDLFREKIQQSDLRVAFSDYSGGHQYETARDFIVNKFKSLNTRNNLMYCHVTTATNTNNISMVFNDVKNILLQRDLQDLNII